MHKVQSAENFAKKLNFHPDNEATEQRFEHLKGVVARLKNLGVTDEDVLSAAWLHKTIEESTASFEDLDMRFGSRVAVLILSLSKDKNLPNHRQEEQYIRQLKESSFETILIKLCDISANLRELKDKPFSKTKKIKQVKKNLFYLNVIKNSLIKNKSHVPGILGLITGINDVIVKYGLKPIIL